MNIIAIWSIGAVLLFLLFLFLGIGFKSCSKKLIPIPPLKWKQYKPGWCKRLFSFKKTPRSILCIFVVLLIACAGQEVIQLGAEILAQEVGIAVSKNNVDSEFVDIVDSYYSKMKELANMDDKAAINEQLKLGINYLLEMYTGDSLTSKRISSNVMKILKASNLPEKLEIPEDNELLKLSKEYILTIVKSFVDGVHIGATYA